MKHLHLRSLIPVGAILGAAGIAAAGNIISSIFTNKSNKDSVAATNKANVDLWRQQTEYNSPQNQIDRLRGAGLNPNLAYGSVTNSAANAPMMQSSQSISPFNVDPLSVAQIANLDADTSLKESQAGLNDFQLDVAGDTFELNKSLTLSEIEKAKAEVKTHSAQFHKIAADIELINSQISKNYSEDRSVILDNLFKEHSMQVRLDQLSQDLKLTNAQTRQIIQSMIYYPKVTIATLADLAASSALKEKQGDLLDLEKSFNKVTWDEFNSPEMRFMRKQLVEAQTAQAYDQASWYGRLLGNLGQILGGMSAVATHHFLKQK